MKKIPELVAPWWSYFKAMVAWIYWADAIYLGVPYTSLRMRQNKIKDFEILQKTIDDLHKLWKKVFLTMNIFPRNTDIKIFESIIEKVSELNADAIIFGDPWTYMTLKKYMPNQKYHLSTQTNTLNYEAVKFWYDLWVHRIVLARELTLKEVEEIKKKVPWMELEVFVHWAMCIAYSWRCLLGEYFSWRDWNKWECSHVCRYKFKVTLEEEKRPWKKFNLIQDENWSHILSSKDLCTINRLKELIDIVDCVKIEWRSKWEFYVWSVVKAYRHVLDSIKNWFSVDEKIKNLVYQIPHRPYWEWFLFWDIRKWPDMEWDYPDLDKIWAQVTLSSAWPVVQQEYFGLVLPNHQNWYFEFIPKQNIKKWDILKYISPSAISKLKILDIRDKNGNSVEKVWCNIDKCYIKTDVELNWREICFDDPVNY